jgi:ferrous iron transport protein B
MPKIKNKVIDLHTFQPKFESHPKIALVGQPNCGKSTIFNKVAGYKSISTNFPGATVEFTKSHVKIQNHTFDLYDLPGTYSLLSQDAAEEETKKMVYAGDVDVIINVVDASLLGRSLELTLELLDFKTPVILCLNMMDEASRKGITIDTDYLSALLQIPVIETIGSQGHGITQLFNKSLELARNPRENRPPEMTKHVQEVANDLSRHLTKKNLVKEKTSDLFAKKILEQDPFFIEQLPLDNKSLEYKIQSSQKALCKPHGITSDEVISNERHAIAMKLFERSAKVKKPKISRRDKIDDLLMHPVWGYVFMLVFLFAFFNVVFKMGAFFEGYVLQFFNSAIKEQLLNISSNTFVITLLDGIIQGIAGGIAIVIPFLLPFLIGLGLLEDFGYLPRIAFLMDRFMHRIGLHGTAVIPGMLGYGCSVPAVMATRILSSRRDRFIASVVAVLVPCAARMTIILGLVGYYLGGTAAFLIYFFNIIVISIIGTILSRLMPEDIPGMILEMPSYQLPSIKVVLAKTWLRLKDFVIIAWPILIIGSAILSISQWYQLDAYINTFTRPITYLLDLPTEVGTTLIFGIMRKELSMLMLFQALGTSNVISVMSQTQILVFTLFVVFYIPCLATLGVLAKEIGLKRTIYTTFGTLFVALFIGLLGRVFGLFFL